MRVPIGGGAKGSSGVGGVDGVVVPLIGHVAVLLFLTLGEAAEDTRRQWLAAGSAG